MLKQRIITALILLPIMLGMLFFAPYVLWVIFSGLIAILALWEYGRMAGFSQIQNYRYLGFTILFCIVAYCGSWKLPALVWCVILLFWLIIMPLWLNRKWILKPDWKAYSVGWVLMMSFWFSLITLRPDVHDATSLLAIMGLVWVADIFAYFSGKAFGKHKLAPSISPGKSWEGVVGGMVCVIIYMIIVWNMGWLAFNVSWFGAVIIGLILAIVSVCGDLLESWLKRAAGIKDSSHLLPGHGGVFDRIDSLIAVLSVYTAIMILFK